MKLGQNCNLHRFPNPQYFQEKIIQKKEKVGKSFQKNNQLIKLKQPKKKKAEVLKL